MSDKVIKCESVYKIFGANAKKMLQDASGNVDAKTFQEAGCIVGVNNASFEVSKGEMLVVMGLSGSGKSTLLRCISRLTDATAGKIFIEGQDLLSLKNKELIELRRNKMGMVFQSFALLPHKTVLENIAFPLQIKGMKTEDSISKAMEMVKLVGLEGRENYFPRELSGGQQQRVGIARSLAVEPDILGGVFFFLFFFFLFYLRWDLEQKKVRLKTKYLAQLLKIWQFLLFAVALQIILLENNFPFPQDLQA